MTHIFIFLSATIISLSGFTQTKKADDPVVATVGTQTITLSEFRSKFDKVKGALNPPTPQQFLEDLVRFEVGLQEAKKRKMDQDPEIQERMMQELYKGFVERSLNKQVDAITVSEKEMKQYYDRFPEIRTSHILISLKPNASAEQRREAQGRANEIYKEVVASKRPFPELVKLYSDDVNTKPIGGDTGFVSRISVQPQFYESILKTKVGQIAPLIETPFGFHIVKVTEIRSFENANKRQLRAAVFDEKRKAIFDQFFNNLKKSYQITTQPNLLR